MSVRLSERALLELGDILWWYEDTSEPAVAAMMEQRFWEAFQRIGQGKVTGIRRISWLPDPYRFLLIDPYWIIWRTEERTEIVVAILHARRDIVRILASLR